MTGTVLMRTVQVLEHAVADPEATPVSRLLFGAVGVFGLRGEPGLDGVAAATAPATYDPDTHTVGVDVGTGASQAAAGNHAHAGVYDPAGTAAAAVAAVTPASIGAIPASEKATPSGVATLDSGGKIPTSQLPALAITTNWVVASQAAMLALDAQEGDVAIRTDVSRSFILGTGPASTLGSWHELLTPTDSVLSVDGRTGTVTLGDLYAALVHGHAQSDITGLTTALAGKASTTHAGTHAAAGPDPVTPAAIGAVATTDLAYAAMAIALQPPSGISSGWATNGITGYLSTIGYTTTDGINTWVEWTLGPIAAGTYTLRLIHSKESTGGIATVSFNGSAIGTTIDMYAASSSNNNITDITGIALAAGRQAVRLTGATKNASSTGYRMFMTMLSLTRTGA